MQCPHCCSTEVKKNGKRRGKQNHKSNHCDRQFIGFYNSQKNFQMKLTALNKYFWSFSKGLEQILSRPFQNLPYFIQHELRRHRYKVQIRRKSFKSNEVEYQLLGEWVKPGDWVLDIGANVGHYSLLLSQLVGSTGRVLCFEPVPSTVDLLASNISETPCQNLSIFNVAVSDKTDLVDIYIPESNPGSKRLNYYRAKITQISNSSNPTPPVAIVNVLCISIDSLNISHPIKLVKIDVEGHEIYVLKGMQNLIKRDFPILIVEGDSSEVNSYLASLGYVSKRLFSSVNQVFEPKSSQS
jgi:FkbM family methyltransferase